MLFNTLEFFIFFIFLIFLLFNINEKYTKFSLLILNIIFYAWSSISNLVLLISLITFTYFFALLLHKFKNKFLLFSFLSITLFPLILLKYFNFITNQIFDINIVLPLPKHIPIGISFFTLQIIGYLIDVYKQKYMPEKNILNYFIFVSLFSQILSGPIGRGASLLPQIRNFSKVKFDYIHVVSGLRLMLIGYLLKVLISARLTQTVDVLYSNIDSSTGLSLLIAALFFTIQIYCDFCGYSFIACGTAKIIGIDLIQNFNKPYISKSLTEFWRRWHISLSLWFRDYIYIPLGGNRCSKIQQYLNILITFTISGLWHGANWNFLVWGTLNGSILVIERITGFYKTKEGKLKNILSWFITFIIINISWIFFRVSRVSDAIKILYKILFESMNDLIKLTSISGIMKYLRGLNLSVSYFSLGIISTFIFLFYVFLTRKYDYPSNYIASKSIATRWGIYMCIIFLILILGGTVEDNQFIYSNF